MAGVIIVLVLIVVSAAASAGAILLLFPLLRRYALARPNTRSSHSVPTPQGGGIAVVVATLAVSAFVLVGFRPGEDAAAFGLLAAATLLIGVVGAADDIWPLGVVPRLALQ